MDEIRILRRLLRHDAPGVLVDVGAHHGHTVIPFAQRGWEVHAFEPDPENLVTLARRVAPFRNVTVVSEAVSNKAGRSMLYASDESSGISSLATFAESHKPRIEVSVTTLTDYAALVHLRTVTALKIDVEGYELRVLEGFPWRRFQPLAVVLEFEDSKTHRLGYSWKDLASFLTERDYEVLVSEWYPIVAYGGQHQWRAFSRYPAELADDAAWGNLIAVRPHLFPYLTHLAERDARAVARWSRVEAVFSKVWRGSVLAPKPD